MLSFGLCVIIIYNWLHFAQEKVGRCEIDAAGCKTVYLSEYVSIIVLIVYYLDIEEKKRS